MINLGASKYKGLLITISFFLVFFILVALFNIYLGKSLNQENERLNKIIDVHSQIAAAESGAPNSFWQVRSNELKTLFDGGDIAGISYSPVNKQIDRSTYSSIQSGLSSINNSSDFFNDKNRLNGQFSSLEEQWASVIASKEKRFQILQYASIVLAILYFLGIVFQMVRNFDNIDSEIEVVKNETENILSTVNEGLFLITPDHEIGAQQSQALKGIFGMKEDIEGNFFDFLNKYVSENSLEIAKDFLGLLFGKRVKEKLIDDLNPLKRVQVNLERRDGSFETHYISFDFKRVLEDKDVQYILGSATDVTQEVLLELELEETRTQSEAQIDLFLSVLHVPPAQLKLFVNDTNVGLNHINSILKDNDNKDYKDKISQIGRVIHKIKGDAALLNLHSFEVKAHEFEEVMAEINKNPNLKGEDLLPLAIQLKNMIGHKDSFLAIFDKFDSSKAELDKAGLKVSAGDSSDDSETASPTGSAIQQMVKRIADEYGKHAGVIEFNSALSEYSAEDLKPIEDSKIQLIRNAVAHGIESPEERIKSGKNAMGTIYISTTETTDSIELMVKDDGAGIDVEAIKQKALDSHIISEAQASSLDDKQIAGLIFNSNFSTKDDADLNAGRGVGLNLVKEIAKAHDAKIGLVWKPDSYTAFKLVFPKENLIEANNNEDDIS